MRRFLDIAGPVVLLLGIIYYCFVLCPPWH